jgi:hypothetical protein
MKHLAVGVALLAVSLVLLPQFWIYVFMLLDFYTPWKSWPSPTFNAWTDLVLSLRGDRPELPIPEVHIDVATVEEVRRLSNHYAFPVVIRGAVKDTEAVKSWGKPEWWIKNFPNATVLCQYIETIKYGTGAAECSIQEYFDAYNRGNPFYISGASDIFGEHPELLNMIETPKLTSLIEGERIFTQIFMGFPKMGSDIHTATGVNYFRQISGRKKWWFIPPSQTAFLYPAINENGFSAHTKTWVGKGNAKISPHMSKLERYTAILEPGDVLINPPWFWHGILNLGDDPNELVIGVPTRYRSPGNTAGFRTNPTLQIVALHTLSRKYGNTEAFLTKDDDGTDHLEAAIRQNRLARANELTEDLRKEMKGEK